MGTKYEVLANERERGFNFAIGFLDGVARWLGLDVRRQVRRQVLAGNRAMREDSDKAGIP